MMALDPRGALALWPVEVASCELAAQRENVVYRVADVSGEAFALRVHRPGYRTPSEIQSELLWMAELERNGLAVPKPMVSRKGAHIESQNGTLVSLLTWLPGTPLGHVSQPLQIADRTGTFHRFGAALARLHAISDDWPRPQEFDRPAWDIDGLTGNAPHWGPYWENPALSDDEREILKAARDRARSELLRHAGNLDFGLIHADVVRENVLLDGTAISFIDFDDCGTGFRLFDVATALLKNMPEPDFQELEASFLAGYHSLRPLDTALLRTFLMLRALTYLGWIIPKLAESGAALRNQRNLAVAMALAHEYVG